VAKVGNRDIEDQIRVCKTLAERDGISVLENHIYFDEAQSGRPAPIRVVGTLSDFRQQGEGPPSAQTRETLRFVPMLSKPLLTAVSREVIGDTSEFDVSGANSGEPRSLPWLARLAY